MSDELGSKKDTNDTVGEHVDDAEQAASADLSTADETRAADSPAYDEGSVDAETSQPAEEITRSGAAPDTTEFRAAGSEPDVIAPGRCDR